MFIRICFLVILVTLLNSCECVVKPNCNGGFYFVLQDKVTGKDLIQGPDAKYKLDSVKAHAGSDSSVYQSYVMPVTGNKLECELNGTSDTLYLKLDSTDTDTLLLSFKHQKRTLCCQNGMRVITAIKYNGKPSSESNGVFILQK